MELLERILSRENMFSALDRVRRNRGSHGVDGMSVDELPAYLKTAWPSIRQQLRAGTYVPQPVRRVEIPKPDGGKRLLGIPTVVDRLIQQAMTQILSPIFEENFSEHSYGFRPGRSAHDAVKASREYFEKGYNWVVDIDLEKFFDRVNHDVLMSRVARKISDKRVLRLIRKYLESGVLLNGVQVATEEGTPQGGPMSPLLANILLDDLDKELERRGHVFCRYADDCNIYVRSKRAGERVMSSIGRYLEERLKLKVNRKKSAVDRVWRRKFLGFSFYRMYGRVGIRIHPKSLSRFKQSVRYRTRIRHSRNFQQRLSELNVVTTGWVNYYGLADAKNIMIDLDKWICRRLRACIWTQWKLVKTRRNNLMKLGVPKEKAWEWANSRKAQWRVAGSPILQTTLTGQYLAKCGYKSLLTQYLSIHSM